MIRRAPRKEDWFVAFSKHAQNSNMSFKATGLYFYLCSLPDNWKINRKDLSNRKTDGSTSVQTIMAELRELGYLRIEMIRDSEGRIISKELVFYEDPEELSLVPEKPSDGHKGAIVQGSTGLEESSTESKDLPVQERESSFAKVAEPNESGPVSLSLEQHKLPDLNANDPISRWLKEYWKHRPTSGHPLARLGISDVLESMTRVDSFKLYSTSVHIQYLSFKLCITARSSTKNPRKETIMPPLALSSGRPASLSGIRKKRPCSIEQAVDEANIPIRFEKSTLDNYEPHTPQQEEALRSVSAYMENIDDNLDKGKGLTFVGPVGAGKTHLAAAVITAAKMRGYSAYFITEDGIFDRFKQEWNDPESEIRFLQFIQRVRFLCIDDMGIRRPSDYVTDRYEAIINNRYTRSIPTTITTNRSVEDLSAVYERQMSRLSVNVDIEVIGPDMRRKTGSVSKAVLQPGHINSTSYTLTTLTGHG